MTTTALPSARPFRLELRAPPFLGTVVAGVLERALALDRLNRVYAEVRSRGGDEDFVERVLDALHIGFSVRREDLERVPADGPVVVVANHPFGGVEGLVLAALLRRRRPDVRIVVNRLLACIPEMRGLFFFVDAFGGPGAASGNRASMLQAVRHVRRGGLLAVFPSGTVSHATMTRRRIADPGWNDNVAGIARRAGAAVVPVHFEGCNGPLFQAAGFVHPLLRTALLPREILNKGSRTVCVRIGQPIRPQALVEIGDDHAITAHLRARTDALAHRGPRDAARSARREEPIADATPTAALVAELESLPDTQLLVRDQNFRVLVFAAQQAPSLLHEIGREREITFRAAGEGTGRALDVDPLDHRYLHLLLWDAREHRVAGAYRLARTDRILRESGPEGLYLPSLFDVDDRFFARLGPALELGRSFVGAAYQRSFSALTMLWRGIGAFVAVHPHYRMLVGPVSISGRYSQLSRALAQEWLTRNAGDDVLARHVRPRMPASYDAEVRRLARELVPGLGGPSELSAAMSDLEPDGAGLPVLVREYLKLGGRFCAFNVDPDFGHCLDGLVVVDLVHTRRRVLDRYLGADGAARFLAAHAELPVREDAVECPRPDACC